MPEKERGKKERKKERKKNNMANCYKFNIHSYRFCVSYIGVSVSRVGLTRTLYSIFF